MLAAVGLSVLGWSSASSTWQPEWSGASSTWQPEWGGASSAWPPDRGDDPACSQARGHAQDHADAWIHSDSRAPDHAEAAASQRYVVAFATLLGGSADEELREVIPDSDGSLVLGGQTASDDFPVTEGAFQTVYGGEPPGTGHPGVYGGDGFVARLAPDGGTLRFSTFFGGSKQERNVYGMALDSHGDIVITTMTRSSDLPTTGGAFQPRYGGGTSDWVAAKLSADGGDLVWCTFIGGSGDESPRGGLALGEGDHVFLVGNTDSANFPVTEGAYQQERKGTRDAAIVELAADGSAVVHATLLGGGDDDGIMGARVGEDGRIHVGGHTGSSDFPITSGAEQSLHGGLSDAFLAGLSADLSSLDYATYLGGVGNEWAEHRLALLPDYTVLLTGVSASSDYPTTAGVAQPDLKGANDGFLAKVSAVDGAVRFSTLLGGSSTEFLLMPTVDRQGNIHVVGHSTSQDFPVTPDALQPQFGGGAGDGVYAILGADGAKIIYATYLGGSGDELVRSLALGPRDEVFLVGKTTSPDFPTTVGAFQTQHRGGEDTFVVKLVPAEPTTPTILVPFADS